MSNPKTYSFSVLQAKSGKNSLQVNCPDGSVKTFHSLYDPEGEARTIVDAFAFSGSGVLVMLGLGLGYHVVEAVKRFSSAKVVVVELLPQIFEYAKEYGNISEVVDKVKFFIGLPVTGVIKEISKIQENMGAVSITLFSFSPSVSVFPQYYKHAMFSSIGIAHCDFVKPIEKRILALWDFRYQPYSIGDLLHLQIASKMLAHQHSVNLVDVCFLAERKMPCRPSFAALGLNEDNYIDIINSLFPVIFLEKNIGAVHFFDTENSLDRYLADNASKYHLWPSLERYYSHEDYLHLFYQTLLEFYRKYGYVPSFSFRKGLVDWARWFFREYVSPYIPVTVHLRNAGRYHPTRNANMEAWIDFFKYCQDQFQVRFVVVGTKKEVDERLHNIKNVIIAKDFNTTVDQDLALIYGSAAFLGVSSGPASIALFGQNPYTIFNIHLMNEHLPVCVHHSWGVSFVFGQDHQRCVLGTETTALLISEFSRMYSAIDLSAWQSFDPGNDPLGNVPLRCR